MEDDSQQEIAKRLEELRKKRALELQRRSLLKHVLTPEAYERLSNIRAANPSLYEQLSALLAYLQQNGQIKNAITEEQLKEFISRLLQTQRRETTIKRIKK